MSGINRRTFIAGSAASLAMASSLRSATTDANDTVVLALMGAESRGSQLARGLVKQPGCRIAYVCDPDERAIEKGIAASMSQGGSRPKGVKDFREALDDPAVDALVCAAPNHWHAAATTMACAAGKHVYVEKPCSHTAEEGEIMIAAAKNSGRVIQVGMQRRSGPLYQRAIERIRDGVIGDVLYGKSWYFRDRPSIGVKTETTPPAWLDFKLWQGPIPDRPYRENILHYNWHFYWDWGDAELGNNGVHTIDLCRWAMGIDYPSRVTVSGSRMRYDDDQETPDTCLAHYECDGKTIVWEGVSWTAPSGVPDSVGVELRGTEGMMLLLDKGYQVFDSKRQVVEEHQDSRGDDEHLTNFLEAVRNGTPVNSTIEEGHKSALFCHLGNISYRLGAPLEIDSSTGRIKDHSAAQNMWGIEYRDGWAPVA